MLLIRYLLVLTVLAAGSFSARAQTATNHSTAASLTALRGVHPRLYLNAARLAVLQKQITTTHAAMWKEILTQADALAKHGPPAYRERDSSGEEQLYQREVGNAMPTLAMAWKLTGDRKYLDSARAWALASCGYRTWGLGSTDGGDLAAGHQLFGLAMVYDWCFSDLDKAALQTIRETLIRRGNVMYQAATGKHYWHRSYLQNHLWVNVCGLSAAGMAISDEHAKAATWVDLALDKFQRTMEALGPDGASHEGVGYWGYGVEYLLKFMFLSRELLGVDLYHHAWWKKTADYRLYLALPRQAWNRGDSIVDLADCPRYNWYGPDYLLHALAHEFHDGHAQWLARELDAAGVDDKAASWLNMIWYDPVVKPEPPTALPTLRHFEDMDIVSARTDWSGDESLVVFKCGPFIGHEAVQRFTYDPGGGHVHPDANHFVVFGNGEWLLRDDGYLPKFTGQHNTLLIDGKGQLGEGAMWFKGSEALAVKARPRILRSVSTPALDYIAGDATQAYPRASGLQRFVRHLIFMKPDVVIVVDDIVMDKPHALELRFHPEKEMTAEPSGALLMKGTKAALRLELLTGNGVAVIAGLDGGSDPHGGKPYSLYSVKLKSGQAHWRNAVALSWAGGQTPPRVQLTQTSTQWKFTVGAREAVMDWSKGEVRAP